MSKHTQKILYEDNHLLVIHKASGVLSQDDGSGRPDVLTLMKEDLKIRYQKPGDVFLGLVHRLDFVVPGIMVLAKTSKAASRLSREIRERRFEKRYLALCEGIVEPMEGTFEDMLQKDKALNKSYTYQGVKRKDSASLGPAKASVLHYKVLKHFKDKTLVEIDLVSGRSHQIRVQFASRGLPLLGDTKYGAKPGDLGTSNEEIALLAYKLIFKHPTRDEVMHLTTTIPEDAFWQEVRLLDLELEEKLK